MEKKKRRSFSSQQFIFVFLLLLVRGISFSWGAKEKISANPSHLQNSENCTINHRRLYTPLLGELAAKPGNETTPTRESAQLRAYV